MSPSQSKTPYTERVYVRFVLDSSYVTALWKQLLQGRNLVGYSMNLNMRSVCVDQSKVGKIESSSTKVVREILLTQSERVSGERAYQLVEDCSSTLLASNPSWLNVFLLSRTTKYFYSSQRLILFSDLHFLSSLLHFSKTIMKFEALSVLQLPKISMLSVVSKHFIFAECVFMSFKENKSAGKKKDSGDKRVPTVEIFLFARSRLHLFKRDAW